MYNNATDISEKYMEDEIETELMHKKWEKGFAKLEKDLDDFREYSNSTKNADVILTYANIMRMQETKFSSTT